MNIGLIIRTTLLICFFASTAVAATLGEGELEQWFLTLDNSEAGKMNLALQNKETGLSIKITTGDAFEVGGEGLRCKSWKGGADLVFSTAPDGARTEAMDGSFEIVTHVDRLSKNKFKITRRVTSSAGTIEYRPFGLHLNPALTTGQPFTLNDEAEQRIVPVEVQPAFTRVTDKNGKVLFFNKIAISTKIGKVTFSFKEETALVDFRRRLWWNAHLFFSRYPVVEEAGPFVQEIIVTVEPDAELLNGYSEAESLLYAPPAEVLPDEQVIAPTPKRVAWGSEICNLVDGFELFHNTTDPNSIPYLSEKFSGMFSMQLSPATFAPESDQRFIVVAPDPQKVATAAAKAFAKELDGVDSDEKYFLEIKDGSLVVAAQTDAGLWNGIQTLVQIARKSRREGGLSLPAVTIADWPDMPHRAFLFRSDPGTDIPSLRQLIDLLVLNKYNIFYWELHHGMVIDGMPEFRIKSDDPITEEEFRGLVDLMRSRNVELIPTWHIGKILYEGRGMTRNELAAAPWIEKIVLHDPANEKVNRWRFFDISMPETFDYHLKMSEFFLQATGAKKIQLAIDEVHGFAVHAKNNTGRGDLILSDYINKFTDHYSAKGVHVIIDHDMFFNRADFSDQYAFPANAQDGSEKALDLLRNRDFLSVNYWDYGVSTPGYPVLEQLLEKGFSPTAAVWFRQGNIDSLTKGAKALGIDSMKTTTWGNLREGPERVWDLRGNPRTDQRFPTYIFLPALNYAADRYWNVEGTMNHDVVFETIRTCDERIGLPPASTAFPIDLSARCNRSLTDEKFNDGTGFDDLGPATDMASFPVGDVVLGGISFSVPADAKGRAAGISVKGKYTPTLPAAVEGIDVGKSFKKLVFLHTYVAASEQPINLETGCRYIVTYADGTEETIVIQGDSNIMRHTPVIKRHSPLNTNLWLAWNGYMKEGPRLSVYAYEWENPHPGKTIKSLSVKAEQETEASVFLLAVTGME